MKLFSARQLSYVQGVQEDTMPDEAVITIPGELTQNDLGETMQGPDTTVTIPCRLIEEGRPLDERAVGPQHTSLMSFRLTYSKAYTLSAADTVLVNGEIYEVQGVVQAQSYKTVHQALLQKVG